MRNVRQKAEPGTLASTELPPTSRRDLQTKLKGGIEQRLLRSTE